MTRHKHAHTGLVTPSLPQLWLTAMLRVFAMLVLHVASTLQMTRRPDRVNATRATPADLPRETSDTNQENQPAAQHRSPTALMVSSTQSVRPSNHKGVLTNGSQNGSGSPIRVPREGGDPVFFNKKAREALRTPARHSEFPLSRETRQLGLRT